VVLPKIKSHQKEPGIVILCVLLDGHVSCSRSLLFHYLKQCHLPSGKHSSNSHTFKQKDNSRTNFKYLSRIQILRAHICHEFIDLSCAFSSQKPTHSHAYRCVLIHMCIHTQLYTRMLTHTHAHSYTRIHTRMHTHAYARANSASPVHVHTHVWKSVFVCKNIYIYIYVHTQTHIYSRKKPFWFSRTHIQTYTRTH